MKFCQENKLVSSVANHFLVENSFRLTKKIFKLIYSMNAQPPASIFTKLFNDQQK
jgi:hypothetical protein